jgi:dihydroorotate dehydrogenase
VPLVGSGGIHNTADVHAMRAAGAVAVQVDGVLLRAPWLLTELASNSAPET